MSENNSAHREELMFRSKVNVIHTKKELEPTPMTPYVASKVTFFSNQVCTLTSVAKAMKVLRKLRCLQIEVGIVQSLCRNDCHQVILLGQVLEIVE